MFIDLRAPPFIDSPESHKPVIDSPPLVTARRVPQLWLIFEVSSKSGITLLKSRTYLILGMKIRLHFGPIFGEALSTAVLAFSP